MSEIKQPNLDLSLREKKQFSEAFKQLSNSANEIVLALETGSDTEICKAFFFISYT